MGHLTTADPAGYIPGAGGLDRSSVARLAALFCVTGTMTFTVA
jgi:hypothetical protein